MKELRKRVWEDYVKKKLEEVNEEIGRLFEKC